MNVSKKVTAQTLGHLVALVVGYVAARQGVHVSPTVSAEVAGLASVVVGPVAGYLAKDEASADEVVGRVLATLASSGVSPRSVLSVAASAAQTVSAPVAAVDPVRPASPEVSKEANAMPG